MKQVEAIKVSALSKTYGSAMRPALDELSLSIASGEVYGFLGPNGAGKSTTIRLLMDFLKPSSGSASILGLDTIIDSVQLKKLIGYLSGDVMLYQKMTGQQHIDYVSELSGSRNSQKRAAVLAERFKADLQKPISELSKGNKQKIGIVMAFMKNPEVLILDEPTSGLDPLMQAEFYALVGESKKRGGTLFISSHNLSEVQHICDRVGIIRDGVLVSEQKISDLAKEAAQTFTIVFANEPPIVTLLKVPGVTKAQLRGERTAEVHAHGSIAPLLSFLGKHKALRLSSHELDLGDEFMRFYESEEDKDE